MRRFLQLFCISQVLVAGLGVAAADDDLDDRLLLWANSAEDEKVLELLQAGADANAQKKKGSFASYGSRRPLHIVLSRPQFQSFTDVERIIKALLDSGADPNARDGQGNTPAHVFVASTVRSLGSPTIDSTVVTSAMSLLLQSGANPNARDDDGSTPLHLSVTGGGFYEETLPVVLLLLDSGANPNVRNHGGMTALHVAAEDAGPKVVLALLDAGADPTKQNLSGKTPLQLAEGGLNDQVVRILQQYP